MIRLSKYAVQNFKGDSFSSPGTTASVQLPTSIFEGEFQFIYAKPKCLDFQVTAFVKSSLGEHGRRLITRLSAFCIELDDVYGFQLRLTTK